MYAIRPSCLLLSIIYTSTLANAVVGQARWIPFDSPRGVRPIPGVPPNVRTDPGVDPNVGARLNWYAPGMFMTDVNVSVRGGRGSVTYQRLAIPSCGTVRTVGLPELPTVGRMLEVPPDAKISVEVRQTKSRSIGRWNVYPAQRSRPRQQDPNEEPFDLDDSVYQTDANYPGTLVTLQERDVSIIRGHRVVSLMVHPVQYNPARGDVTVYSNIEVEVKYGQTDPNGHMDPRLKSEPFEQLLAATVLNYRGPELSTARANLGGLQVLGEPTACDYLILTPGGFYQPSDPNNGVVRLADWKRRKGHRTLVVDLDNTPGLTNTDAGIRRYLQNAYDTWAPPPTYVLLVGDVGDDTGHVLVPTNYGMKHPYHGYTRVGTDLPYTTLDGNDYLPDVFLGRLSVDTVQQADAVIGKILAYETQPPPLADYYKRVSLAQLFEDQHWLYGNDCNEDPGFSIIESAEAIREYLFDTGYDPHRVYGASGQCQEGPQCYQDGTSLPLDLKPPFLWNGTTDDIRADIENGCFLLAYNGHGSRTGWGRPAFDTENIAKLRNDANTPVVLSMACMTGWFDNESDALGTGAANECFSEQFLRRSLGGAVAVIGASRVSYADNDFLILGLFRAIWPDFSPQILGTAEPDNPTMDALGQMGQINTSGKLYLKNNYYDEFYTPLHFELYNLFGDPEMPLWTREPVALKVDQRVEAEAPMEAGGPPVFLFGVSRAATGAPIPKAVVVLTCADAQFMLRQETDAQGYARFPLEAIAPGQEVTLTVTGRNCLPHEYHGALR